MAEWQIEFRFSETDYRLIAPDGQVVGVYTSLQGAQAAMRAFIEESLSHEGEYVSELGDRDEFPADPQEKP